MSFYYRNMYVCAESGHRIIFYKGQGLTGPFWFNVTDSFDKFIGNGVIPSTDDLDIFIFEYELKSGLKPCV